jgi:hypothetical protein
MEKKFEIDLEKDQPSKLKLKVKGYVETQK